LLCFQKNKDNFENHNRIYKGKNPKMSFDKNEFQSLKNQMNVLDSTLKICAFNVKKLDAMFQRKKLKRNTIHKHTTCIFTMHNTIMHLFMARCTLVHIVTTKTI